MAFPGELPTAWARTSPEKCKDRARLVVHSVETQEGWLSAAVPQPHFAPFFADTLGAAARGTKTSPVTQEVSTIQQKKAEATGIGSARSTPFRSAGPRSGSRPSAGLLRPAAAALALTARELGALPFPSSSSKADARPGIRDSRSRKQREPALPRHQVRGQPRDDPRGAT